MIRCIVVVLLLTFFPGKSFSMDFWTRREQRNPDRIQAENSCQALARERKKTEEGSDNESSSVSRGVLMPGKGPSEKEEKIQADEEDFIQTSSDDFYDDDEFTLEELSEEVSNLLSNILEKYDELKNPLENASKQGGINNSYSFGLQFVQRSIDRFKKEITEAEEKQTNEEQKNCYKAVLQDLTENEFNILKNLKDMKESAQYFGYLDN